MGDDKVVTADLTPEASWQQIGLRKPSASHARALTARRFAFGSPTPLCCQMIWVILTQLFAGFWLSPVPISMRARIFKALHQRLLPGSSVFSFDNRFVVGSSSTIIYHTREDNSFQQHRLANGSLHQVLKIFLPVMS